MTVDSQRKPLSKLLPQIGALYSGAFPYSFDFLYWEEAPLAPALGVY